MTYLKIIRIIVKLILQIKICLYIAYTLFNELMLTVKLFSFPVSFKHIVKVMDITNYVYKRAKFPVPGNLLKNRLLKVCFTN